MRSLVIFIIIGIALRFSSGIGVKSGAAYGRVVECFSKGFHARTPGHNLPADTVVCGAFKALELCFTKPLDSTLESREILDFARAYQLQRIFLVIKSKMCQEPLRYQKLKELVMKSGIMEREKLSSIEGDTYVGCAGEINRKCYKPAVDKWEHHSDAFSVFLRYIDCFDEKAKACDAPMTRHYNAVLQAFKKHLEEKHGLLGGMMKEIEN